MLFTFTLFCFFSLENSALPDSVKKEVNVNQVKLQRFSRSVANGTPYNKSANLKQVLEDVVTSSFKKICHNSGNLCPRGLPGPPGRRGRKGSKGMMGQPGRSGKQGIMGPPGIGGVKGMQGDTGAPGIQGAKGSKGDTGALGVPGAKGNRGVTGAPGIPGAKGIKGDTGAPGVPGMKGKPLFEHTIPLSRAFQAVNLMTTLIFLIVQRKINKWMRTH